MKIIITIVLITLMILTGTSYALTGLRLLAVEQGARPVGMGGAFSAVDKDPYSMAYNPAATYGLQGLHGSAGHNTHWKNVSIETGYLAFTKKDITFSTGIQFAGFGKLEGRGDIPTSDFIEFEAHDISVKFGVSFELEKNVYMGLAAGYMYEKIDIYRGSAINFDLGLLFTPRPDMNISAALQNIGKRMNLRDESFKLPSTGRVGASYRHNHLLAAIDIVAVDDDVDDGYDLRTHLGGEYQITPEFSARAGYRLGYESKSFSAGFGFTKRNFRIDYAFLPYSNENDDSHLINLTFSH